NDINYTVMDAMSEDGYLSELEKSLNKGGFFKNRLAGSIGSIRDRFNNSLYGNVTYKGVSTKAVAPRDTRVAFDAETHSSINKVIPGYLGQMLAFYEGEEISYNYSTGRWTRNSDIQSQINDKINSSIISRSKFLSSIASELDPENSNDIIRMLLKKNIEGYKFSEEVFENIRDTYGQESSDL